MRPTSDRSKHPSVHTLNQPCPAINIPLTAPKPSDDPFSCREKRCDAFPTQDGGAEKMFAETESHKGVRLVPPKEEPLQRCPAVLRRVQGVRPYLHLQHGKQEARSS